MSTLTFIIAWPLLGAALVALTPRSLRFGMRLIALAVTLITMLLAIKAFWLFPMDTPGYHFLQKVPWVSSLGIHYEVGADGINIGLILMGAIVAFAAACVSWEIREREKEFYFLLLIMTGGILGAFASLDLFFFFFFHELALIPTFIMIGVWGRGAHRGYAAFKMTLYLSFGALIALAGLIALYLQAGAQTFSIPELTSRLAANPLSGTAQQLTFPFLLFGFGILVSLWPFHTWAPLGYSAAPTATAMLHAGVLKKFGLYGLIRVAIPMLPDAARDWMPVLAWLCLGNILFIGLVAIRQKDLNLLIGHSSVAHMGFAFLGIASLSLIGITGTVVIMVAHGFLAALTFALSGYLLHHTKTLEMSQMGGLLRQFPFIGTAFMMAAFAACGVPGFANFAGEVLVFFGAWTPLRLVTILAAWGALIIGAVYMLRAVRAIFHGPPDTRWEGLPDAANAWRRLPFALLLAGLLVFGVAPRLLTDRAKLAVESIVARTTPRTVAEVSPSHPQAVTTAAAAALARSAALPSSDGDPSPAALPAISQ